MVDRKDQVEQLLSGQISFYDHRAWQFRTAYRALKILQIVAAASIPVFEIVKVWTWVVASLASLIVVLETIQQVFQLYQTWISYRVAGEALRRERNLYMATAGRYHDADDPVRLLAERIEELVAQEQNQWQALRESVQTAPTR
jgi:Protein of unknown function (DUF4231)